jgi:hypothetical protein
MVRRRLFGAVSNHELVHSSSCETRAKSALLRMRRGTQFA